MNHPINNKKNGIDVSYSQGQINWPEIKNHIDFAIIRCGYGDNIESQDDAYWNYNADMCTRLGIPFGVYIYSYAANDTQSRSEAEHVLRLIRGYKLSYPVYLDLEEESAAVQEHAVRGAQIFGDILEASGYNVGIYANLNWFRNIIGNRLDRFSKWVAQYNTACTYEGRYDMWQYTSAGYLPGILGNVDMNYDFSTPTVSAAPDTFNPPDIYYAVKTRNYGILPDVKNRDDYAGWQEDEIIAVKIGVSSGAVRYRVHLIDGQWLDYVTGAAGRIIITATPETIRLPLTPLKFITKLISPKPAVSTTKPFTRSKVKEIHLIIRTSTVTKPARIWMAMPDALAYH